MKIRSGFVSNSSSSSFVIKVKCPFYSALDVAEYMIPQRGWENDGELVDKVRKLKKTSPNIPAVCFNSCNYDTFIAKMDDIFLISTCHNHDWDLDSLRVSCPPEYEVYFGDEYFYELQNAINFYHLDYDVTGRPIRREDAGPTHKTWCEECFGSFWWVKGSIKCVSCGKRMEKV